MLMTLVTVFLLDLTLPVTAEVVEVAQPITFAWEFTNVSRLSPRFCAPKVFGLYPNSRAQVYHRRLV